MSSIGTRFTPNAICNLITPGKRKGAALLHTVTNLPNPHISKDVILSRIRNANTERIHSVVFCTPNRKALLCPKLHTRSRLGVIYSV